MFRLFGKQRGSVIAVADIGGGSAGVAIVESMKDSARVLVAERVVLSHEDRSPEANASTIVATVEQVAQKALATYTALPDKPAGHISTSYAIVRAPWTHSKTVRAESIFEKDTRVEESMISALAKEGLEAEKDIDHKKVLEASVVRVELNGYPTAKPKGKVAHRIAASVFLTACDATIKSGTSEALSRVFACPPPIFRSGIRALLLVLKESNLLQKYCFVINMTSQATTLITVRKDVAVDIVHVPEGTRSVLKRISKDRLSEETLNMMRMLASGTCDTEACEQMKQSVAGAEPELVRIFGEAMGTIAAKRRLPNDLILLAPEDLSSWLQQFFSRIDFAQFTATTRPFSPRVESMQGIGRFLSFSSGTVNLDPPLFVASALVSLEVQHT